MKKKIDIRLLTAFMLCLICTVVFVLMMNKNGNIYEESIYSYFCKEEQLLPLEKDIYVIDIDTAEGDGLISTELRTQEIQKVDELRTLVSGVFSEAEGVYILGNKLTSQPYNERKLLTSFREAGNVFWHNNEKNVAYYHEDDKCGQIKFLDEGCGNTEYFEIFDDGKYKKNFLPYYYITMSGRTVRYDEDNRRYVITDKEGQETNIYAAQNGSVRKRKAMQNGVKHYTLNEIYRKQTNTAEFNLFEDAIIIIWDSNVSLDTNESKQLIQQLPEYYIDVMATIENAATIPMFDVKQEMWLVLGCVTLLGLSVFMCPVWISVVLWLLEMVGAVVANMLFYHYGICYVPIVCLMISASITFFVLLLLKMAVTKVNVKNLPIDAVIRFTNTIINIDQSVSYSEYLSKNRAEIEEDISASLLMALVDKDSFLLRELAAENNRNKHFVEREFWGDIVEDASVVQVRSRLFKNVNYVAFIPLPVFDIESEGVKYTVIGLKKKLRAQKASYISMMLFSMYIYFKAQHERGEHQRMYFSMLSLMISVIDAKDPVTAGHSQRVAAISKDIGIWLNLSKNEQFDLEFTALLHDIGKIGVSDYVLNKQSVYTQNDFEQMKYHTIRGAEMLSEVGISEEIIDGVRHHHERIDGRGYPDGIKGDELNLFAKIIKIADVYDALTSKRQYKDAWEVEKALNIIYRGRGTEFDEGIADVFIEHMSPPGWIPPVEDTLLKKKAHPNTEKAIRIAKDFYEKYSQYISVEYPIPSKKASVIDFSYEGGFMGYDWGETFNNSVFLKQKPMILAYENATKSLLFGQSSKDKAVRSVYYYFFKGFVNMGVYLLEQSQTKDVLAKLEYSFQEPSVWDEQMMVYEADKMRIVFYRTADEKCLVYYISDYMCANYKFEEESSEVR